MSRALLRSISLEIELFCRDLAAGFRRRLGHIYFGQRVGTKFEPVMSTKNFDVHMIWITSFHRSCLYVHQTCISIILDRRYGESESERLQAVTQL